MKIVRLSILTIFVATKLFAQTDISDCEDHPVISRYPGAVIEYCEQKNFTEFSIAAGPETGYRQIDEWITVAGRQNRIYYVIKGDKTITEVYYNYLNAINNGKYELIANQLHQERNNSKEIGGNGWIGTFYRSNPFPTNVGIKLLHGSGTMGGTFYIAAKKGNIYLAISGKRYTDDETVVFLDVLETQEIEDDLITVNAEFIADKLFKEGKVALQGILFDHNQATIKNESKTILNEIAVFLNQNPTTIIFVVGHTDMTGEVQYNIGLSERRAIAVTNFITNQHQISASRLLPHGVGPLSPVDNNSTEAGMTKNRRVELVLKSR